MLVRFASYWGPKAKLDQVIFRPIADNAARLQALQSGEIQGFDLVDPEDIGTISSNTGLKLLDRPGVQRRLRRLQPDDAADEQPQVRQAVAYGLDRASVVKAFYAGRGWWRRSSCRRALRLRRKGVPTYPYNPDKAKQLLQRPG